MYHHQEKMGVTDPRIVREHRSVQHDPGFVARTHSGGGDCVGPSGLVLAGRSWPRGEQSGYHRLCQLSSEEHIGSHTDTTKQTMKDLLVAARRIPRIVPVGAGGVGETLNAFVITAPHRSSIRDRIPPTHIIVNPQFTPRWELGKCAG